jgi:hypothetical protein
MSLYFYASAQFGQAKRERTGTASAGHFMSLDMGIGVSSQADVYAAGQEAAEQVVSHLANRQPDLVMVFSSIRFADPRMLKAVRSVTGAAPLIGCTDAGGIITAGPRRRSVTVVGFVCKEGSFVASVERNLSSDPRGAGERLAESLLNHSAKPVRGVFVFPDGLSVSGSEILSGLQKRLGPEVALAGGMAADDFYFQKTFQFFNDEIMTDSMPGVAFGGNIKIGIGSRHGWVPVGRPRKVTRSTGHIVYQLDHRPAISIYEDFLGLKREELTEGTLASMTLTYPLGTEIRGQSEYLLRDAVGVGRAGSLICTGDILEGSEIRLMIGGYESALEAAQQAACDALDQLEGQRFKGGLIFCSVARQKMLGSEFQGEIDVIRDALGGSGVRLGGFYSYGELSTLSRGAKKSRKSSSQFQNESVVVVAFG